MNRNTVFKRVRDVGVFVYTAGDLAHHSSVEICAPDSGGF